MRSHCTQGYSQSTTRQWAQSPQSPTHGDNSSRNKELSARNLLHFLISFKDPHRHLQISTHKAACMTCWASKGPQQLQKAPSGARWEAESPATPRVCPPLQQSAIFTRPRWIKYSLLLTKPAVSFHIQTASLLHFMKSFKPFEKPRLFSHPAKYKLQALIFSSGHLRYTKLSSEIVNGSIYCLLQTIPFILCSISALMVWGREDKWGFSRVNSFAHHCSCSGNHFQGHVAHLRRHSCSFPFIHSFTVHAFPACLTESPGFYWEMIKTQFLPGKKLCCYAFCTSWLWKMLILSRLGISVVVV